MTAIKKEIALSDIENNACITVFETHEGAEKAIMELEKAGYDMK
jgi:hypothetical protein